MHRRGVGQKMIISCDYDYALVTAGLSYLPDSQSRFLGKRLVRLLSMRWSQVSSVPRGQRDSGHGYFSYLPIFSKAWTGWLNSKS